MWVEADFLEEKTFCGGGWGKERKEGEEKFGKALGMPCMGRDRDFLRQGGEFDMPSLSHLISSLLFLLHSSHNIIILLFITLIHEKFTYENLIYLLLFICIMKKRKQWKTLLSINVSILLSSLYGILQHTYGWTFDVHYIGNPFYFILWWYSFVVVYSIVHFVLHLYSILHNYTQYAVVTVLY